ncbi:MAG: universal stress protein UspE [Succinivibrio sp.]|nr:universal stress protein UspE [Succinivibrio sp.]
MRNLQNILVVIEPGQMRQPALDRALAVNQYTQIHNASVRNGKKIETSILAVLPVNDFSKDLASVLSVEQESDIQRSVIAKHERWLDAYLKIHAMGVKIERKVIWSKDVGPDITALVKEHGCNLIIKTADVHGMLDSVIFTPLDWQLLRHSPVPVLIAKDHMWNPTGIIAVAVNFSDPDSYEQRLVNMRLLREAQELSRLTHCEIHLINAIPPFTPPLALDMPSFSTDLVNEDNLKENLKLLLSFAERHRIAPENCHVREGLPDDVIPTTCSELNPTALFIGTHARRGMAVALIGNICERVVDELQCDIAVITPKSVVCNLPTSEPTKKVL